MKATSMSERIAKMNLNSSIEKELENKLGKEFISSLYKFIDKKVLKAAAKNANWVIKSDKRDLDDNGHFLEAFYTKQSALWGSTDYKDHTKITLKEIKLILKDQINKGDRCMQNIHYYNVDGKIFDICIVTGYYGGYSVYPAWSDGKVGYLNRFNK